MSTKYPTQFYANGELQAEVKLTPAQIKAITKIIEGI